MLDHREHVRLRPVQQVDHDEVAGDDRLGLRAKELRPRRTGIPGRGRIDAGSLQDLPHRRGSDLNVQAGQLSVDPTLAPTAILPRPSQDQGPDGPLRKRGPGSPQQIPVPAQHRLRRDDQTDTRQAAMREQPGQQHQPRTIGPGQLTSQARITTLRDSKLMTQHQNLYAPRRQIPPSQPQPCEHPGHDQIDQLQPQDTASSQLAAIVGTLRYVW